MTAKELNTYINKVLGNSIRCLLPSYWWKRLLTQIVEYVDGIDTKFDNKVKTLDNKINTSVSDLENEKQDVLISGTSIKTINGVSILGSGDIEILSESEDNSITESTISGWGFIKNADKPLIESTSNTVHLLPNKYYRVNTKGWSSLTITLEPETDTTKLNEYLVEFNTASYGTTIVLPDTIKWANGEIPSFIPDATYLISIVNNLGIATGFK